MSGSGSGSGETRAAPRILPSMPNFKHVPTPLVRPTKNNVNQRDPTIAQRRSMSQRPGRKIRF